VAGDARKGGRQEDIIVLRFKLGWSPLGGGRTGRQAIIQDHRGGSAYSKNSRTDREDSRGGRGSEAIHFAVMRGGVESTK